jgi:hypothetical protein
MSLRIEKAIAVVTRATQLARKSRLALYAGAAVVVAASAVEAAVLNLVLP